MNQERETLGHSSASSLAETLSPGTLSVLSLFQNLSAEEQYNALMLSFGMFESSYAANPDMLLSLKSEDLREAAYIFTRFSNTLVLCAERSDTHGAPDLALPV